MKSHDYDAAIRKMIGPYKMIAQIIPFQMELNLIQPKAKEKEYTPELIPVDQLQNDEYLAMRFQMGAFSVRVSKAAWEKYSPDWTERKPVSAEVIQSLREHPPAPGGLLLGVNRIQTVVSACTQSGIVQSEPYQYICHAQEAGGNWSEHICFICAVMPENGNNQNVLLVHKLFLGSSDSSEWWYQFHEDGTVKETYNEYDYWGLNDLIK